MAEALDLEAEARRHVGRFAVDPHRKVLRFLHRSCTDKIFTEINNSQKLK